MIQGIENLPTKKLMGQSMKMSLINNKTDDLWKSFMPIRKEIDGTIDSVFYSIQVYEESLKFEDFTPHSVFTKWAAVEVTDFQEHPEFECFVLKGGLYAVFIHKGMAKDFPNTLQFIFEQWLPKSKYKLDQRPHFEIIKGKYDRNDPNAEEEVWIPIKIGE